jgi:hypothetical protein
MAISMSEESKNLPGAADHVGQAAGGITGVFAGAAIGSSAGPIGTLLGGIAGAIGGWWSGRAIAEAAEDITVAEDQYYRAHFERSPHERRYDDARPAYFLGDLAAANPQYEGRAFEEVEPDLNRGWSRGDVARQADWDAVRDYASEGFRHGRERRRTPRR